MTAKEQFITSTQELFQKLPPLAPNTKELFIKIAPWYAGIFGGVGVLVALLSLRSLDSAAYSGAAVLFIATLNLASSLLLLLALKPLKLLQKRGWEYLFWSGVIHIFSSLLAIDFLGILFAILSLYIAFQIRQSYK